MARGRQPKKRLTHLMVRQAGPGRYCDGRGLQLVVRGRRRRCWVQRITIQGFRRDLGLGSTRDVSLAEAREIAEKNHKIALRGGDPRAEAARERGPTFFELYEVVTENRSKNWKTAGTHANWRRMFANDVLPAIGHMPIGEITLHHVRDIVKAKWNGRNSKGYLLRQNIGSVFAWAVANHYRPDNPAANLLVVLPKVRAITKHHSSLPYREAPTALVAWQELRIKKPVTLAVLFLILTAARLSEATCVPWREINLSERVWRVPAPRMKGRKVHKVPLSEQAVKILKHMKALKNGEDSLVFPVVDRNGCTRQVSQGMVSDALRKLGRTDAEGRRIVAHGFRATFRVWAIEQARAPREVCEAALAHHESDATVAAYTDGADPFDDRRELMQTWADFLLPRRWSVNE